MVKISIPFLFLFVVVAMSAIFVPGNAVADKVILKIEGMT
ncbi:hypothetical protein D1AOALGA4SA_1046 [Olavius algarvensis Delta 1 endosymbiont]|nr:hypothetical protein D1AOALGA4SA_1046 [Olavius algarvensis Delta 1 endosymbiont]